jgi:RHS repeat-associated protein
MELDSVVGQYFDHARNFRSVTGKFTTPDRIGYRAGDTNLYRYVQNNPIGATDTSGFWSQPGATGGTWGGGLLLGVVIAGACVLAAAPVMTVAAGFALGFVVGGIIGGTIGGVGTPTVGLTTGQQEIYGALLGQYWILMAIFVTLL